jgi:tyrosinase
MTKVTRRRILAAGATGIAASSLTLPEWLARRANAQTVVTRYDAGSAEGVENLKIYARAVARMMDPAQYPQGNPRSWTFQWYTHWTRGTQQNNASKVAEIARIYGSGGSPDKALAETMWNTCQAHASDNPNEENFLPWHRIYVLYLEEIVRTVAGASEFTLPYWSYNNSANRALPPQFRMQGDPVFGALYRENRNSGVNSGTPIDQVSGALRMNNDSLGERSYLPGQTIPDVPQGFCKKLDYGLHGAVHVNVGTPSNMGFVPTAAGDPIFWLHHCEIDRFWASWNNNGGRNPAASWNDWGTRSWTFVDGSGQKVTSTVAEVIKGTLPLGYRYDALIAGPIIAETAQLTLMSGSAASVMAQTQPMAEMSTHQAPAVKLADDAVSIQLESAVPESAFKNTTSKLAVTESAARPKVYLAVDNLTTDAQPGVGYDIYLDLPKDASPQVAESHYVGSIGFFHAHPTEGGHTGHSAGDVFDITQLAANLAQDGKLTPQPTVTIVPAGKPVPGAGAAIGSFRIVISPNEGSGIKQ